MPEEPGKGEGNPALAHQLLSLALSRPHEALARSRAVLAARPPALDASIARQAAGIGLREIGDLPSALREMRAALRLARASGRRDREVDVLATLGATLTRAGRSQQGLAMLDEAIRHAQGALAGRVMLRRADALFIVGRYAEALEDLRGAVVRLRRAGDLVWEARSLAYRGFVNLALGETGRADADFAVVERLHSVSGQELEYAMARNNRGLAAFARGDLPKALEYLDDASRRFEALATPDHDVAIDRVRVLLAAGLTHEALRQADEAVQRLVVARGQAAKNAELLFTAASAALAAGDLPAARIRAGRALRLFRAQGRDLWAARAEFLAVVSACSGKVTGSPITSTGAVPTRPRRRICWPRASRSSRGGRSPASSISSALPGPGGGAHHSRAVPRGWPRHFEPSRAARSGACLRPATAGWTRWTSIG